MSGGQDGKYNALRVYGRLIGILVADHPIAFSVYAVLLAVQGLIPAAGVWLLARLIAAGGDFMTGEILLLAFAGAALLFVGLQFVEKLFTFGQYVMFQYFQRLLAASLERRAFEKTEKIRMEVFERSSFHDQFLRAHQVIRTGKFLDTLRRASMAVQNGISVLTVAGVAASFNLWLLASAVLATLPITVLRFIRGKQFWQLMAFQSPKVRQLNGYYGMLTGRDYAKELRLFELQPYLVNRWRELRNELREERWRFERRNIWRELLLSTATLEVAAYGLGIALAVGAAMSGNLPLSALAATLVALRMLQDQLRHTFIHAAAAENGARFVADLFRYYDEPEEEPGSGKPMPSPLQLGIRLEKVSFRYPGSDRAVLSGISLHILPGEKLAIVGENGAGKSTLVKLLLGEYRPTEGRILYDETDLQELDRRSLRASMSAVMQDYVRYQYSVYDNIAWGDEYAADEAAVARAAEESGAAGFIGGLPEQYRTRLGKQFPNSTDLSGGQWQQLAIARGYMRRPQVLALDEPSASLDPLREADIYRQFHHMSKGRITITVSHRLASCRLADRIVVLAGGAIAEIGSHEELMRQDGLYASMFKEQEQWYR